MEERTQCRDTDMAFFSNFICLFWAVLGLRCCVGFSLVAASRGYCPVAVYGLLAAVTSPAVELRL